LACLETCKVEQWIISVDFDMNVDLPCS
jgi:hypothetical protein